ncbi:non-ribosomal peptide synthetase, partial [Pseudomonas asplenii]|uniref:non-ribosomal peptide synthetase n=1 Tax=Pseudomonas asplenii TaxID=53407 RepID=UPI00036DFC2D
HLAWAHVLGKVSGKQEVVFGTVLMGRMQGGEGAERALGMFINTLPLRVAVGDQGVRAGIKATHARLTALLGHEHASLALAQRCSGVAAPTPLFSALLNYRHSAAGGVSGPVLQAWHGIHTLGGEERTNYPLALNVDDLGDGFSLSVQAVAGIDAQRICGYMQTALAHLVEALESAPDSAVRDLPVLPAAEREQLLGAFNASARDYPRTQTVHGLFEAQVRARPEACAAIHDGVTLTYAELNARANRLARHLRDLGVQPGDSVAILLARSHDLLVSQLAALKCAAVYVPLDINAPLERQGFMIEDSQARVLLTHSQVSLASAAQRVELDRLDLSGLDPDDLGIEQSSESVAYIMYTSGSTGTPKGVMVPHRAITRLVINNGYADFNDRDRIAFASNPAFDASTMDVWGALLNGGQVLVVDHDTLLEPARFGELLISAQATVLFVTTAVFNQYVQLIPEAIKGLRILLCGGERGDPASFRRLLALAPQLRLVHCYGPTETTTYATTHHVTEVAEDAESVPIGRPIGNTQVYILDAGQQLVPLGVSGEICIGGKGVARGYLNRPELSAEKFIADPFSDDPDALLYRTGDLGRWSADGLLECLGRNDDQVKMRGFRIELGEIEARLSTHPQVGECIVLAREDVPGDKRLVAYVTATGEPATAEELRSYLQGLLPEYMVPSAYVQLAALPLNLNGKVDRKLLPVPASDALARGDYQAPQGEVETLLASIWAQVLKVERVGRHDHFFELGGHSLLAVTLIERMRQAGLSTDVRVLFSQPTLAALAAAVGSGREIQVPVNAIGPDCTRITPQLLPLANLEQADIDRIVATVPGGVANVQDIYALAPLQAGILYHHLSAERGDPYLLQARFAFDSEERLEDFARALQFVIDRHDILRTAMVWEGLEEPVQVVWRQARLVRENLEPDPLAGEVLTQLHQRFNARDYALDIRQAPMLRLIQTRDAQNRRWLAMLLFHHLAMDHTAMEVLQHEMQAYLLGQQGQLGVPIPYRNYVAQARLGVSQEEHERFFRERLGDIDEPTLPFGLQQVQGDGQDIEEAQLAVGVALGQRMRAQARQSGVSVASLVHLAWAQVLGRVSARDDVVFGTVLLGRMEGGEGADRALGMFINTLPLRVVLGGRSAREGVRTTHGELTALLGHEHASLALAQRCSGVPAPTPLFSALLNYRHSSTVVTEQVRNAWQGMHSLDGEERTNYPLTLNVDDRGEDILLIAQTVPAIEAERICAYMHQALHSLVDALEQASDTPLQDLPVVPDAERRLLLEGFNATAVDYPRDLTLHGLFEARVATCGDAVAVVDEQCSLSYDALNRRANRIAHRLIELGVGPDDRVAICVDRSVDMLAGLLGILKAGAAYVPLDPYFPLDRLSYMLESSAPVAILTQQALLSVLPTGSVPVLLLDPELAAREGFVAQPERNPSRADLRNELHPEHLAYVIYTSGSTGRPKGVQISHRALSNFLQSMGREPGLSPQDRLLAVTTISFDIAALELYLTLVNGACVVLASREATMDAQHLQRLLDEQRISVMQATPATWQMLVSGGWTGKQDLRIFCGGEALPRNLARELLARSRELWNLYGPTEATIWACVARVDEQGDSAMVPIGKPMDNTRLYLLDENRQPVPLGVAGELYIAGVQVARGYLNRPDLTAERFLDDPFQDGRMYRTGDLARYLPDGTVEYLGRNDDQVKIRGFRIELGEIEARLATYPGIKDCVVVAREDQPGDKRLVAYFTPQQPETVLETPSLREHLQAALPDYMVPTAYLQLDALPLTPNRKVDRKALPAPDGALFSREYQAPQGKVETVLASLWADLLKVERVGRNDHFFELGGHSLLAVTLIERMRQVGLSADVRVLLGQPTLAALAAAVGRSTEVAVPANLIPEHCGRITPDLLPLVSLTQTQIDQVVASVPGGAANVQDIYPLAPLQEGILFHHLSAGEGDPYVLQSQFGFDSRNRLDDFVQALQSVIERHDVLRTSIVWEGLETPLQVVWRRAPLKVETLGLDPRDGELSAQLLQRFDPAHYRLDLRQAPLLHLVVSEEASSGRWLGILLFHHIAIDHTTLAVVQQEMQAFLRGQATSLAPAVPYRNYVAQARLGVSQQEHEGFFREMLGDVDEPTLPFEQQEVRGDGQAVGEAHAGLSADLSRRLRGRAREAGVSPASVAHLAWGLVLGRLCQREKVVFGTVLLGRMQGGEGAERALGMFINTLPLRLDLGEQGTRSALKTAHGRLTALLGHEHASLALAQRCSGVPGSLPLFSALLNYRHGGGEVDQQVLDAWQGIGSQGGAERTNYPLSLSVDDDGVGFGLTVQAVAGIDAQRVCGYMQAALESLVDALEQDPEAPLSGLSILPADEREQLLVGFNDTVLEYPQAQTIHGLFEAQVRRTPDALAV